MYDPYDEEDLHMDFQNYCDSEGLNIDEESFEEFKAMISDEADEPSSDEPRESDGSHDYRHPSNYPFVMS